MNFDFFGTGKKEKQKLPKLVCTTRRATLDDVAAIIQVYVAAKSRRDPHDPNLHPDALNTRATILRGMINAGHDVTVAEHQGCIEGYYASDKHHAEINDFYTRQERRGVGKQMLDSFFETSKTIGAQMTTLTAMDDEAEAFYRANGFDTCARMCVWTAKETVSPA